MSEEFASTVAGCRASGLSGWDLIDHATHLVDRQFTRYSVLHPWESATTAFARRRGFCSQYNGALAGVLRRLGFDAWAVYAARVRIDDHLDWRFGHTWVRVRLNDEVRDACARLPQNRAGDVHFVPVTPVRPLTPLALVVTSAATYAAALTAIVGAWARRRPRPDWVDHPRP